MAPSDEPKTTTLARFAKAVYLRELRAYPEWVDGGPGSALDDGAVVYVHDDLTVSTSLARGAGVLFQHDTPSWRAFLRDQLGFEVPEHVARKGA